MSNLTRLFQMKLLQQLATSGLLIMRSKQGALLVTVSGLALLSSGCASVPKDSFTPSQRVAFMQTFAEFTTMTKVEDLQSALGSGLRLPRFENVKEPVDALSLTQEQIAQGLAELERNKGKNNKELANSLYWVRCGPNQFVKRGFGILGLAVTDPSFTRSFAEKAPYTLICPDNDAAKIEWVKGLLIEKPPFVELPPNARITVQHSGLKLPGVEKLLGSSVVSVSAKRAPSFFAGVQSACDVDMHLIFERIEGDPSKKVMLIGFIKDE